VFWCILRINVQIKADGCKKIRTIHLSKKECVFMKFASVKLKPHGVINSLYHINSLRPRRSISAQSVIACSVRGQHRIFINCHIDGFLKVLFIHSFIGLFIPLWFMQRRCDNSSHCAASNGGMVSKEFKSREKKCHKMIGSLPVHAFDRKCWQRPWKLKGKSESLTKFGKSALLTQLWTNLLCLKC
jgi:hypothetical protein